MAKLILSGCVAVILTLFAGGIWAVLLTANLRTSPAIPWSVVAMGAILWIAWQYFSGKWGQKSTAATRHRLMRANAVPRRMFLWSLLGGTAAIAALVSLWIILAAITEGRANPLPSFSSYPWFTTLAVIVMASLVSSIAEEIGIRGYLQSMLEARTTPVLAILIPVLALAPGHALTQGFRWNILVFYLLADTLFGVLAYLTNSIVPGIIVHSIGLLIFFTFIWPFDATRKMMTEAGPAVWFWICIAQFLVFGIFSSLVFIRVAGMNKGRGQPA